MYSRACSSCCYPLEVTNILLEFDVVIIDLEQRNCVVKFVFADSDHRVVCDGLVSRI
jgi:hypothetical protein